MPSLLQRTSPCSQTPRIAVVTGGSRGLGRALVSKLQESGFIVVCAQRNAGRALDLGQPVPNVRYVYVDLANQTSVEGLASALRDELPFIDLLVNNAAVCPAEPKGLEDRVAYWQEVMEVNFFAPLRLTERVLPLLQASSQFARVVNVSSGDGELLYFSETLRVRLESLVKSKGAQELADEVKRILADILEKNAWEMSIFCGQEAYKLSKAALNAYTRFAALRPALGPESSSVAFVSVCPGDVDTAMGDSGAVLMQPEEAAERMLHVLDVGQQSRTGVFLRHGKEIDW